MARVKKKDYENLSDSNIRKVMALLEPKEGKPITKKEACEILNISYNTTRLKKIIETFLEQQEYVAKRKKQNRGRPASNMEISEAVVDYLRGEPVSEIAKSLFRTPNFVKDILDSVGVPHRPSGAEEKAKVDFIPEECMSESFAEGEIVWSAKYHTTAIVKKELSKEYQDSQKGYSTVDYEDKYSSKCYAIYVVKEADSSDSLFSNTDTGGFNAYSLAYDLAKLDHLTEYGIDLTKI